MNGIILQNRKNILQTAEKHGITELLLFGSYLHGTENQDSDIDFLVELKENRDMLDLVGFKFDMEELLGKKVDVVTKSSIHRAIADQVLKEAKPI